MDESCSTHGNRIADLGAATDEALLFAVGQQRDRLAFEEIYRRYHRPAYNLALYLTDHSETAQDAVQVSFFSIWRYAANYKGGSPRGWLFQVFARGSLYVGRKERRRRSCERQLLAEPRGPAPLGPQAGSSEILVALRSALRDLPDRDRKIIALLYGAGLSQRQVAADLKMSQRAISYRSRMVLEQLRSNLAQGGFAGALPMLARHLGPALLEGVEPPAGLQAPFVPRLQAALQPPALRSAARGTGAALWAGAALVLASASGLAWWAMRTEALVQHRTVSAGPTPVAGTLPEASIPWRPQPLASWRFNKQKETAGLRLANGSKWHWVPDGGPDGSGCMETDSPACFILFERSIETFPLKVSMRQQVLPPAGFRDGWMSGLAWTRHTGMAEFYYLRSPNRYSPAPAQPWVEFSCLVTKRFLVIQTGAHMSLTTVEPDAGARLLLVTDGKCRIDDLSLSPADPREVPDLSPCLEALDKIPPERRRGAVELPGLPCPIPGKKVTVKFYPPKSGQP